MASQFGEDESHQELSTDDDEPGPVEGWATQPDTDAVIAERPGRDADECERDGEVRQEPEGPPQLRLDA